MRYTFYILLILLLICNNACTNKQDRVVNKDFPKSIKLTSERIEIQEIIRPVGMIIHGDYLIIQNDQISDVPCFNVYSLESLKFLYSFARLGGGVGEFVAPLITQCNNVNLFFVFDQAKRTLTGYNLSDSGAHLSTEKTIQETTGFPLQELSFINDSIFLFLTVNNEIMSYNLNSNTVVDSFTFKSNLEKKMQGDKPYNKALEFFHFSNANSRIVTGHNFINKISTNTCNESGLFEVDEILLNNHTPGMISPTLYDNLYYYLFVEATNDFVFAQYYGYPFKGFQPFPINMGKRHFDSVLEVLDWSLNKKAILEFDSDILRCTIDEKRKKIYTWNPLNDFDYILSYDIKELYEE